ncbi:MAG: hypothetical protein ACK4WH_02595 [Phycisphaerales bacterium]
MDERARMKGLKAGMGAVALAAVAGLVPGCTGLEPAVIGAGASAAETSASFFAKGQVTTFEAVGFDDTVTAAREAAGVLRLRIVDDEPGNGDRAGVRHRLVVRDERAESTVIVLERRTETVTMIHADVGTFGPTPLASLIVNMTLDRLRRSGAYERAQALGAGATD